MEARTGAEVARLFKLLGSPTRALILLERGEGPRDTTALALAAVGAVSFVSTSLTALRRTGLVETIRVGKRHEHSLTPTGRMLAEALKGLSAE